MTQEVNDDMSAMIIAAEESILRISDELGRMKTAADLLEDAGQRSQLLQDAVDNLVIEIGSLVELSGRIIGAMNELEVNRLVEELRIALTQRMDGLGREITAKTESATERAAAELRGALIQRMDSLEKKITIGTESATERVGAELRGTLVQRMDSLEKEITVGTESATERVSAEVVAVGEQRMTEHDEMLKHLDAFSLQVAEVRDLVEKSLKRKGLLF